MRKRDILDNNRDYIINAYQNGKSTNKLANEFDCNSGTIYFWLQEQGIEVRKQPNYGKLKIRINEIRELYNLGFSAYAIAKKLGFSKKNVLLVMQENGMSTSHLSTQREDNISDYKDEIVNLYQNGKSCNIIAEQLKMSCISVIRTLDKEGIKRRSIRRYSVNQDFFTKIDNEAKAYLLGWFYSDGNVNSKRNSITLTIIDLDILEKIKELLEYTGPIYLKKRRKLHHHDQYCLNIIDEKLCGDLINLGCMPNKTHKLTFPSQEIIPNKYLNAMCRGYFDGDGSFSRNYYMSITGNRPFLEGLEKVIFNNFGFRFNWYQQHPERKNNIYTIGLCRQYRIYKFLSWLYKDATYYLERKYDRFLQFLDKNKDKISDWCI